MSLLSCDWRKLAFANYIVPPEILEKFLPAHTQLDYYNGNCFVSLVGFQFQNVKVGEVQVPFHRDFEEINLRFYVKRFDGQTWRHGTVFLTEIADKVVLGALANSLFHENYKILPTRQEVNETETTLKAGYHWKVQDQWQQIEVTANTIPAPPPDNSDIQFLIHRLWGYGSHSEKETNEYKISHPEWQIYTVQDHAIKVDFLRSFGQEFSILTNTAPHSVILAEGSTIEIQGRQKI